MTVEIGLSVRTRQLRQKLQEIPGMTRTEVRRAVKGAEREWKRMPRAARDAARKSRRQMDGITSSISRISPAAAGATSAVQGLSTVLGPGMAAALGPLALAAAAVAALGGGAFMAASRMSSLVDEVQLLAEGTGLSTTQMIAIRHAVSATGGEISKTKEALASFSRVMSDELAGKSGPEVDAVLRATISRIEGIQSPADRAAERMRIFGTESARALAGLTGEAMDRAAAETAGLAEKVDRASKSSKEMDESAASLSRAFDELTLVVGDRFAPNVVTLTEALVGLVDVTATAIDYSGQFLTILTPPGLAGMIYRYAAGATEASASTAELAKKFDDAQAEARRYDDALIDIMFHEAEIKRTREGPGFIEAPKVRAGVTKDAARARRARADAARKQAEEIAKARKSVEDTFRRQAFADEVQAEAERREQIEANRQLLIEQAEQDAQIREQRLARIREEAELEKQLRDARMNSAQAIVDGSAAAVGAITDNSRLQALATLTQVSMNAYAAISRAYAEGGPFLGPALAAATFAQLAPVINAAKALAGGGGGVSAPSGGGGGGSRRGGGSDSMGRGQSGDGGSTIMVAEYRSEIYDAQTYDAIRRQGSPLRDLARRQRVSR